jgi:hypothetical protein
MPEKQTRQITHLPSDVLGGLAKRLYPAERPAQQLYETLTGHLGPLTWRQPPRDRLAPQLDDHQEYSFGLLLLPTITPRGPITWTRPPQHNSLRLCREINIFGALRTVLSDLPPPPRPSQDRI